jgi:preprotein translocase subunit SecG
MSKPSGDGGTIPERSTVVIALVIIHVITSAALLVLVLLHSGKGGGLSDMFGGGMGAAAQGSTVVEKNLDRLTVVAAMVFAFTTLALGLLMSIPT